MADKEKQPTIEEKIEALENSYKELKLADLNEELKELERVETYVLDPITNTVIKYNPIFDQKKIDEILVELQEKIKYVQENNINFFKHDAELFQYIYFLIIKKFTHLKDEIADDFETQLAQMAALVRLGYLEKIIEDVFDPLQILRVTEKVMRLVGYAEQLQEETKKVEKAIKTIEKKNTSKQTITKTTTKNTATKKTTTTKKK